MAQTLKFGNKTWATKEGSTLAYNDENGNYKPLPFAFTRSTSATRVNKEGLIEVVTNDRPRIDYTDTSDGVLLLENAATNLITYSEDFSQSNITGGSISNNITSPDGTLNANTFQEDTNNTQHKIRKDISVSTGTYTMSCFVKGTDRYVSFYPQTAGNAYTIFDIENQLITKTGGSDYVDSSIEDYGNGWYRCILTYNVNSGTSKLHIYLSNNSNSEAPTYLGNNSTINFYGFQLEQNSVASSYIPTQGSAVTRVAETASGAGNSEVFNDSEGVLFVNIAALANDGTTRLISLSNGSDDNRLNFYYRSTANQILVKSEINNGTPTDIVVDVNNATLFSKFSIKYNSSELKVFNNGFEVGSVSGNFSYPLNSLNVLNFDNTIASGSNNFYGKTKELGYYDTALTDLELETLTSYRSWESMVNELNLNIIYNG